MLNQLGNKRDLILILLPLVVKANNDAIFIYLFAPFDKYCPYSASRSVIALSLSTEYGWKQLHRIFKLIQLRGDVSQYSPVKPPVRAVRAFTRAFHYRMPHQLKGAAPFVAQCPCFRARHNAVIVISLDVLMACFSRLTVQTNKKKRFMKSASLIVWQ